MQRHIGPTVVGSFGNVVLERKVNDVKYTFRATETTIQNLRGLNGSVITVEKPFGKAIDAILLWMVHNTSITEQNLQITS